MQTASNKSPSLVSSSCFGAYSRYKAVTFLTRFGTTEYHVTDAELCDSDDMPAIIRQFDSVRDLEDFVDAAIAEARYEGAAKVAGVCSDDLGGVIQDASGIWELSEINLSEGWVALQDISHEGLKGRVVRSLDSISI